MLRSRFKRVSIVTVKKLDAFSKVPEPYKETSPVGGAVSILSLVVIIWLIYSEVSYYVDSHFRFQFVPDTDYKAKLKINVDITVAMPCSNIGADILDTTNQNVLRFGILEEEDTWFELSPRQRIHFDSMQHVNSYLREEFHALQDLLWKSGYNTMFGDMPPRETTLDRQYDACRVYGSLILNKVAGNFHVTAGKSLVLPRGHVHISAFMTEREYNFSHRINRFSFGDPSPGIIHPLEGDEKITPESSMLYQYFIQIVPTEVDTLLTRVNTYQYSVKDHERPIDHDKGSHGIPGIFFKYDMSALKVKVTQERESLWQFLVKLCAVVGGVYVTSGIMSNLVKFLAEVIKCKYFPKNAYQKTQSNSVAAEQTLVGEDGDILVPVSLVPQETFLTNHNLGSQAPYTDDHSTPLLHPR